MWYEYRQRQLQNVNKGSEIPLARIFQTKSSKSIPELYGGVLRHNAFGQTFMEA